MDICMCTWPHICESTRVSICTRACVHTHPEYWDANEGEFLPRLQQAMLSPVARVEGWASNIPQA